MMFPFLMLNSEKTLFVVLYYFIKIINIWNFYQPRKNLQIKVQKVRKILSCFKSFAFYTPCQATLSIVVLFSWQLFNEWKFLLNDKHLSTFEDFLNYKKKVECNRSFWVYKFIVFLIHDKYFKNFSSSIDYIINRCSNRQTSKDKWDSFWSKCARRHTTDF